MKTLSRVEESGYADWLLIRQPHHNRHTPSLKSFKRIGAYRLLTRSLRWDWANIYTCEYSLTNIQPCRQTPGPDHVCACLSCFNTRLRGLAGTLDSTSETAQEWLVQSRRACVGIRWKAWNVQRVFPRSCVSEQKSLRYSSPSLPLQANWQIFDWLPKGDSRQEKVDSVYFLLWEGRAWVSYKFKQFHHPPGLSHTLYLPLATTTKKVKGWDKKKKSWSWNLKGMQINLAPTGSLTSLRQTATKHPKQGCAPFLFITISLAWNGLSIIYSPFRPTGVFHWGMINIS